MRLAKILLGTIACFGAVGCGNGSGQVAGGGTQATGAQAKSAKGTQTASMTPLLGPGAADAENRVGSKIH